MYDLVGRCNLVVRTCTIYDAAGQALATLDTLGLVTRSYLDGLGRPDAVVRNLTGQTIDNPIPPIYNPNPLVAHQNLRTDFTYSAAGDRATLKDTLGVVTQHLYDALHRLTAAVENYKPGFNPDHETNVQTDYRYDIAGNRFEIQDGRDKVTLFTFDGLDRLRTERDALLHEWVYTYDRASQQLSLRDTQLQLTSYQYDGLGRLQTIDYPSGTADVTFGYDGLGNRLTMTETGGVGTGTTTWVYDALDRVKQVTDPFSGAVAYGYDGAGNRTTLTYPDGRSATYLYDGLHRLTTVTAGAQWGNGAGVTQYNLNGLGQALTTTLASGVVTTFGYDTAHRLTSLTHRKGTLTLAQYAYTLDGMGQRAQVTETVKSPLTYWLPLVLDPDEGQGLQGGQAPGGEDALEALPVPDESQPPPGYPGPGSHGSRAAGYARLVAVPQMQAGAITISYVYDPLYRLRQANYSTGAYFHYAYDAVGNRLTQTTCSGAGCTPVNTTYVYDDANRLTSAGGVAQTWSDNGNLLSDGTSTYAYDHANRLTSLTQGANSYTFAYSGLGDRLRQTINGAPTNYTLDLNAGLTQVLADSANTYLYGLGRIGEQQQAGFVYHLADGLGSVRQLTNGAGIVTMARSYQPYGSVLSTAGFAATTYGFAGEATDISGLVHLRARYYAPGQGRFLTADSWPGDERRPLTLNDWNYSLSNPINYTDPSGYGFCEDFGMITTPEGFCVDQVMAEADRQFAEFQEQTHATEHVLCLLTDCYNQERWGQSQAHVQRAVKGLNTVLWTAYILSNLIVTPSTQADDCLYFLDDALKGGADEIIVYRALRPDENPLEGLLARNPGLNIEPKSHISGARASNWISASHNLDKVLERWDSGSGVVGIDLAKVPSRIVDFADPENLATLGRPARDWARYFEEVLIDSYVPPEAIHWIKKR